MNRPSRLGQSVDSEMMKNRFELIRNLFPDRRQLIAYLRVFDEDFQEICKDYEECLRTLDDPNLQSDREEVRLLCEELEEEVLTRLNRFTTTGSTREEELSITIS
jgi:hypothetical protein